MTHSSTTTKLALFVEEWAKTILFVQEALKTKDFAAIGRTTIMLRHLKTANYINQKGNLLLNGVASELLEARGLSLKVSLGTARDIVLQCFSEDFEKRQRKKVSEHAIIACALDRLNSLDLPNGSYVFSTQFSYDAKGLKFYLGPVQIISKKRFYRENLHRLRRAWPGSEETHAFLLRKWVEHMRDFDHLIVIGLSGFEREMGWKLARECAEFALNIVRIFFGYYHTNRIRLSGDFTLEQNRSSLIFEGEDVWLSHGTGGVSSFLDDKAMEHFDKELRPMSALFASFAGWLVSGRHRGSPTVERLRYANRLIAEAYCEPSDYLRLVRLISAFEALAVIRTNDKAHQLAVRCGIVGSWGEAASATEIYDAVRSAYHFRNMVVHGDAPDEAKVRGAFFGLEKHAFRIFVGYLSFYAAIERTAKPKSIRVLAREIRERVDFYFHDPDFGFD